MMNVTRNVVEDLLAVYLAGEASADSRAFAHRFLLPLVCMASRRSSTMLKH